MHCNYYYLKKLAVALSIRLKNFNINVCFTQSKGELVMGFANVEEEFWIKAVFITNVNALSFSETYERSRRNSVDLFEETYGKKVIDVHTFLNERCFSIVLEDNYTILFKLFGNRSNILLMYKKKTLKMFQNRYSADWKIELQNLNRPINQNLENFCKNGLKKVFPTFGKPITAVLQQKGFDIMDQQQQWALIQKVLSEMEQNNFYVAKRGKHIALSLFSDGEVLWTGKKAITAANVFYKYFARVFYIKKDRDLILKTLQKSVVQTQNYIEKTSQKLSDLAESVRYGQQADIIMANLHKITTGEKKVRLYNFYQNTTIDIKLKNQLSPQKNAERLYRKAKNQKKELHQLESSITQKKQQLASIQTHIKTIESIKDVKSLRNYLQQNHLNHSNQEYIQRPFRQFTFMGYHIWVGKNAFSNDLLTKKYAYKEDLWLHAKDVGGSHVVIKHQPGRLFPQPVIEKAAALAAYYSKRKNDLLCPVTYTPKKFVRKPKGVPTGTVILDKEKILIVAPEDF